MCDYYVECKNGCFAGPIAESVFDAENAWDRMSQWFPIETAPTDGTSIVVYCPAAHGLPPLVSFCSYHDSAGFCVDELREPTLWMPDPTNG